MATTIKQSGLSIARNNMKFTLSWKIADADYGKGQQLRWRIWTGKWSAWTSVTIGVKATTATVSLTAADYFPTTKVYLYGIQFQLRGMRNPTTKDGKTTTYDWSQWAEKTMDLTAPETPSLTAALSDSYDNVTTFSWSTPNVSASNTKPFANVEWQTILVKESTVTDGSQLKWSSSATGWATGTGSASGSITRTEDTALLAANSYTRWVRVRARGCGGNGAIKGCSYWKYAKHVYARTYLPVITSAVKDPGSALWVTTKWTAGQNAAHPIDKVEVQWAIDTPLANRAAPSGTTWTTAMTIRDGSGTDQARFLIDSTLGTDKCLWVRVAVTHDRTTRYTAAYYVAGGALAAPTNLSVSTNNTTYRATVTATNNSDVPDSKLGIIFRAKGKSDIIVGYIDHGSTSATVQCPDWSDGNPFVIGVFAFQGTITVQSGISKVSGSALSTVAIDAEMQSATVWTGGTVPSAPTGVAVSRSETAGEVILTWGWSWQDANLAEISWSDNPNAWESTDEPSTYTLSNLNTAKWRVSGLAVGKTWYFRVRLAQEIADETTYGPYSDTAVIDLSSAPNKPVLTLTDPVIQLGDAWTASWNYVSTDGTEQAFAEMKQVTYASDVVTLGNTVATAATARHIDFDGALPGWTTGNTYYLVVRVTSASGQVSAWSDPVAISIADPVTINITQASFSAVSLDDGASGERVVIGLTAMPLTVTVTGAGEGGTTRITIERAESYVMDRPDESIFEGYEGEAVYSFSQQGEAQITINQEDLIGLLDDGAAYKLIATVQDTYGQSASAEINFEVHWTHQALMPQGTVVVANSIATITPVGVTGATGGDTCDVYRLSADKPVMILKAAEFDTAYVDPYPAIGEHGGYRFVFMTPNGDYITEDDELAWVDVAAGFNTDTTIIDFDGNRIVLQYDLEVSHNWTKDFTETTYLGGSIQGDWNLSVHRNTSVNTDIVVVDDPELIAMMRRLAAYPGICHVRTVDGSSFAANVEVSEQQSYEKAGKIAAFTLAITRVDTQELDGMLASEWVTS